MIGAYVYKRGVLSFSASLVTNNKTHVHVVKQDLKRKAATSDLPTKYLVAEATGRLNEETRQKLNCDLNALYKMTRSSRAAANTHPSNPTSLENLSIPGSYLTTTSGDSLLLWDSGWSEELRRSFLFGTPHNTSVLMEADHFVSGVLRTYLDWNLQSPSPV